MDTSFGKATIERRARIYTHTYIYIYRNNTVCTHSVVNNNNNNNNRKKKEKVKIAQTVEKKNPIAREHEKERKREIPVPSMRNHPTLPSPPSPFHTIGNS